ncbi:hypothetical protein [Hymenobacter nivis]|uniref:Uncharacterized protein n=1 Tax=Hymenobacter nivis TaxID=1850093 RepID=A0A502GVR7_9BACT|nr:hypothetical protein [Hymenobacter nivis]TPG66061.1 hypothetical protein EAH73_11875 [Hymenobacter nivis]
MLPPQNSLLLRFWSDSALLGRRLLRYEPTGWDGLGLTLTRSLTTHGVATEHSGQLGFVKDGRRYMARTYAAAGIEADVQVLIEQYDPNLFAWRPYYQGRVHFAAAEFTATKATVNLEQGGWLQQFLARSSVQVDLLSGTTVGGAQGPAPTPLSVLMHSRAVRQGYAASQKAPVTTTALMSGDEDDPSREQLLYFGFDTAETNELGLGAVAGGWVVGDAAGAVAILVAPGDGEYVIELALYADIKAENTAGPLFEKVDGRVHFRINGDPDTAIRLQPDISARVNGSYAGVIEVPPRTMTLTLKKDDRVYLYADYYVHEVGGGAVGFRYRATLSATMKPGSYLRITAVTTTPATTAPGLLLHEAFARLTQALTEEPDSFRSDFLGRTDSLPAYPADGPGALTFLTGGFQLRGYPLPDPRVIVQAAVDTRKSLTTTWDELYGSAAATWGLGCMVDREGPREVVRVEDAAYFYPADVVLDLTSAGPLKVKTSVDAAAHYQVVELGYDAWQAEQTNGLDEFNAPRQWTTPLTQAEATYSQKSKISASGVLLEATRRQRYLDSATTDSSRDDQRFFVCLLRTSTGYETERNQLATRLEGVISPATVYNLPLSPGRLLRRHAPLFGAGLLPRAGAAVRFTGGGGNSAVVSQLVGEAAPVVENADVPVADLPPPWWRPERVAFTAPVSRTQLGALLARPIGRVRYLDDYAKVSEGWVIEFTHDAKQQTGDFTLLPCAGPR